jgi:hypothetical protein
LHWLLAILFAKFPTLHLLRTTNSRKSKLCTDCKAPEETATTFDKVPDECDEEIVLTFEQLLTSRAEDDVEEVDDIVIVRQSIADVK